MALPTKRRREQAQARTREGGAQSRAHSVLLGLRTPARRCPREHRMSRTWTREQSLLMFMVRVRILMRILLRLSTIVAARLSQMLIFLPERAINLCTNQEGACAMSV